MARIVVCGYLVRHPYVGNQLAYLQYLLGWRRLGHTVTYVEDSGWKQACYDPMQQLASDDPTAGLASLSRLLKAVDLDLPRCFVDANGRHHGLSADEVERQLRQADLLVDLGGVNAHAAWFSVRRRVLVDMDPLFTQLGRFGGDLQRYDRLFSVGTRIGQPDCTVPTGGHAWLPTVPPVVLSLFDASAAQADQVPAADLPMTTLANWRAYGSVEHEGRHYGQKDEEFRRLGDLPRRSPLPLELALSGADGPTQAALRQAGWRVLSADSVSLELDAYRGYLRASAGEFSVAKHGYVATRSGWFSDRSVCYLASGRPVLVQDTGFVAGQGARAGRAEGEGLLVFRNPDEALQQLARIQREPVRHRRAARRIAAAWFAHDQVLPSLLERALS